MITIGTDCSGIEAPIQALKQLGIPFVHKWSCEIDKYARQSILANYEPETLYEDITKRDHSQLPDVDLYVAGFPCQSFSLMGKKLGSKDPRSNIMMHCIEVIKKKRPSVFILENVKNFKFIEKGEPLGYLLNELYSIPLYTGSGQGAEGDDNESLYSIHYDIYNTKDYGIPQNRERIYIIGIAKDVMTKEYLKPSSVPLKPFDEFVLDKIICDTFKMPSTIQKKLSSLNYEKNYICCCDGIGPAMKNTCPTLTFSGCKYMYHSTYNRYLTAQECLLLQGFCADFKNVVGDVRLCNQIGNSMSVNVVKHIFLAIFECTVFSNFVTT